MKMTLSQVNAWAEGHVQSDRLRAGLQLRVIRLAIAGEDDEVADFLAGRDTAAARQAQSDKSTAETLAAFGLPPEE